MEPDFSPDELAVLLDRSSDELIALRDAGLLDVDGDGRLDDLDLVRAQVLKDYLDQGYKPIELATAIRDGSVEPFLGDLLFAKGDTYSIEEASAKTGVDPEQLRQLRTALGLARDHLYERDLALLEAFKAISAAGLPWEAVVEGARVVGDVLRRLADTEARLVHVHIHERLLAEGASEREVSEQIFGLQESVVPLLDPLILHLHREHLLQASIEDAYLHLQAAAPRSDVLGAVDATIVFVDVASFTTLSAEKGDRWVGQMLNRLDEIVRQAALEHSGKLVKEIGDAFMLAFREGADAVHFAVNVVDSLEDESDMPEVRVGMNAGSVIFRSGDYTGTAVNVASRVADAAGPGQILLTKNVVDAAGSELNVSVRDIGARVLRGVDQPTALLRVEREQARVDPVCGKAVAPPPAARVTRDGTEYWFCSEDCLRRFLQNVNE